MIKEVVVLSPNGRRQVVKCMPNTSYVQILEEVCKKQGFAPQNYELQHHNKSLDMNMLAKYSTLPNKALLEMVELSGNRKEEDVSIGLQNESGERKLGKFKPSTSLLEVVKKLSPDALNDPNVGVLYMGTAVYSEKLAETSLKKIGLTSGNALLRLVSYTPEELNRQPNVSTYLTRPEPTFEEPIAGCSAKRSKCEDVSMTGSDECQTATEQPSNDRMTIDQTAEQSMEVDEDIVTATKNAIEEKTKTQPEVRVKQDYHDDTISKINMKLEKKISGGLLAGNLDFLGKHYAVSYYVRTLINYEETEDFFELSVEEVRKLYAELKAQAKALSQAPVKLKQIEEKPETSRIYNHCVIRIKLPDETSIQGVFKSLDTMKDVHDLVQTFLRNEKLEFELVTQPNTGSLPLSTTLQESGFSPRARLLFVSKSASGPLLSSKALENMISNGTADLIASKFRS